MSIREIVIVLDGAETLDGRALYLISALYFCHEWSKLVSFRLINVTDDNVSLAAEALSWDEGVAIDVWKQGDEKRRGSPFADADLYVAVSFRSMVHMELEEAGRYQVPTVLAIQYPDLALLSPVVLLARKAAFDPRLLAAMIGRVVRPWLHASRPVVASG